MLLATLCNELSYGPLERRRALGEEATAVARRIGDPATLVHVLYTVYVTALNVPSLQEQHLQASHEALDSPNRSEILSTCFGRQPVAT